MNDNPKPRPPRSYVVLDIESAVISDAAHRRYLKMERFDPKAHVPSDKDRENHPCLKPRWPFREIAAASIMLLTEHPDGNIEMIKFETFSRATMDERGIVVATLKALEEAPTGAQISTFSGTAHDAPILIFAAMRYGLGLPADWTWLAFGTRNPRHLDLAWLITGGLKLSFVHMSELLAVLDCPAKICAPATAVAKHIHRKDWAVVESHCECDVITTALLLAYWCQLQDPRADILGVEDRILREVIAKCPHRSYAPALQAHRDRRFAAQMAKGMQEARVLAPYLEQEAA